jgi:hypothetical protein
MQTLSLITSVISNVEVFAEGVSHVFGSTAQRNLLVRPAFNSHEFLHF